MLLSALTALHARSSFTQSKYALTCTPFQAEGWIKATRGHAHSACRQVHLAPSPGQPCKAAMLAAGQQADRCMRAEQAQPLCRWEPAVPL